MARVRVLRSGDDPFQAIRIGGLVFAVLAILWSLNTTFFQVESDEVGIVLRFGKYHRTTEPGLHFKWPWNLETEVKVKVRTVHQVAFGEAEDITARDTSKEQSLMLTGDLNAAEVKWSVQYKIRDPRDYLFNLREPEDTMRDLAESEMRTVVGDRSIYEVLTVGRSEIADEVRQRLQQRLDSYGAGLDILLVQLQSVNPPDEQVRTAFNKVNQAEQQKDREINQAKQEYNNRIPLAQGEALKTVQEAEGYKLDRVNRALGETSRFLALLEEYRKAPEVTRRRLYLEAMGDVLPQLGNKILVDEDVTSALPLLHVGPQGGER